MERGGTIILKLLLMHKKKECLKTYIVLNLGCGKGLGFCGHQYLVSPSYVPSSLKKVCVE